MNTKGGDVAQTGAESAINQMIGGSILGSARVHVDVSLGKTHP